MELPLSPFAGLLLGQGRYESGPRDVFCPAPGWMRGEGAAQGAGKTGVESEGGTETRGEGRAQA